MGTFQMNSDASFDRSFVEAGAPSRSPSANTMNARLHISLLHVKVEAWGQAFAGNDSED